jgi:dynein intermediate chain
MKSRAREVAIQCIAFPENETNVFFAGAEDGSIFKTQLHVSNTNENFLETISGHGGPITSLDVHPLGDSFSTELGGNLLLSSSMDWSVKLWNPKASTEPLVSFESFEEYVYDVKWSPTHPSVFAAADGDGHLDIWNLNSSLEEPLLRKTYPQPANKLTWAPNGTRLAAGDSSGHVRIYALSQDLSESRSEDWSQLERLFFV